MDDAMVYAFEVIQDSNITSNRITLYGAVNNNESKSATNLEDLWQDILVQDETKSFSQDHFYRFPAAGQQTVGLGSVR